ncbi:MAG TPA: LLM class flavin-dependent oxidoreductase [Ktedonobacterales bacterium]|nr:LLM class flavin-dependent oxidoreductase [Ktedonobacterales bacterium]
MRFAINLPAFNAFADARELADLAREAEGAGWDGFFLWDHLQTEPNGPVADPWVTLTAIAMRTECIRFGALVTPLPRRRPWKFARETATLDRLSRGRLIVGVGIGSDHWREYSAFGEAADDKAHATLLDESLDIVTGLWTGEPFSYEGTIYTVRNAQFLPTPAQAPRIPIWVAGILPHTAPLRRAARWDGVYPIHWDGHPVQPDEIREMLSYIHQYRSSGDPFEVVVAGYVGNESLTAATALLRTYAEAGVTWWQEGFLPGDTLDMVRARIHQGPPTL